MPIIRALSIRQPWAWLIVNGYKDIENREWKTNYRGRVLIHVGKNLDKEFCPIGLPPAADLAVQAVKDGLDLGGVIGVAEIVDCVEESTSPWFFGKFGFVLKNARPLPFFPVKGQQGFFGVDVPEGYLS